MFLKSVLSGAASAYYLLRLRRNQWKSPKELKEIQWKRLKNIVKYAYNHIPYYRMLFKSADFKPEYLKSLGDLRKIPTTTKMDVRRNYSNIIAKGVDISKYDFSYTSGSSGIPMKISHDKKSLIYSTASVAYCTIECGLGLRDKLVKIGGFRSDLLYTPNQTSIPLPEESGELPLTINLLRNIKPDAIYTRPWMINSMCTVDLSGIKPKLIFSHGQTLTQHTRDLVKSKFGIETHDTYGAVEFARLAFECNEHAGMHIITDNSVMEFLEDDESVSPLEIGEIVVTGLNNYAMPLIRYELGDLGVPSDDICSCGRRWPIIKSVEGRAFNGFTLESGRKIYAWFWVSCLVSVLRKNIFSVSEFQIVQEQRNKIVIKLIKGKEFDRKIIYHIKENVENSLSIMGENVSVELKLVDEILVERSGKKKLIYSLIE